MDTKRAPPFLTEGSLKRTPPSSACVSTGRATAADTNGFHWTWGKTRMRSNSVRPTGLPFSFPSPACIANSLQVVHWSNGGAHQSDFHLSGITHYLYCLMPSFLKIFASSIFSSLWLLFGFVVSQGENQSSFYYSVFVWHPLLKITTGKSLSRSWKEVPKK